MFYMDGVACHRPRVEKPVYHWGFSLPKDAEGRSLESLSAEQWEAIAYHSIAALGLEDHQVAGTVEAREVDLGLTAHVDAV